jgi:hypothetical protein
MIAGDPWELYRKVYDIMIDDFVTVAVRKDKSYEPVMVRTYREDGSPTAETKKLHQIHHDNLLALHESFSFRGYRHLILERETISLIEVVACPHYPTVHELVAVVGQVSLMRVMRDTMLTFAGRDRPLLSRIPWHRSRRSGLL